MNIKTSRKTSKALAHSFAGAFFVLRFTGIAGQVGTTVCEPGVKFCLAQNEVRRAARLDNSQTVASGSESLDARPPDDLSHANSQCIIIVFSNQCLGDDPLPRCQSG